VAAAAATTATATAPADRTAAVASVVEVAMQLAEYWRTHPGDTSAVTASIERTHRLLAAELVSLMSM